MAEYFDQRKMTMTTKSVFFRLMAVIGLLFVQQNCFIPELYASERIDHSVIPLPTSVTSLEGVFTLNAATAVTTSPGAESVGRYLIEAVESDIRELVCYAASRFVTIVPEIDLPGHFTAGLTAYPELSCTGREDLWIFPYDKRPEGIAPLTEDILCAGNEKVFDFLEIVLEELMNLFPTQYIHIGGDEAPKTRWEVCEKCQARIQAEGLKDEHELQSYMTQRMADYLGRRRRMLIGWNEIMEGGLAENSIDRARLFV